MAVQEARWAGAASWRWGTASRRVSTIPTRTAPIDGGPIGPRATILNDGVAELGEKYGAYVVDLFADDTFHHPSMWAPDRLHLSSAGHRRVAGHVLSTLGVGVDEDWMLVPPFPEPTPWLL